MASRRGNGSHSTGLALLLVAWAVGAGCSGSGNAALGDGGSGGDAASGDVALIDVGQGGDGGGSDVVVVVDAGVDAGTGADVMTTDAATDAGASSDGGRADAGDGGSTGRLRAGSSIVSAGTLMRSTRFQMISTLGGRSVQQTFLQSPNFRLRGGLVGTIGAR